MDGSFIENNFLSLANLHSHTECVFKILPMRQYKEGGARRTANVETVEAREVNLFDLLNDLLINKLGKNTKRFRYYYRSILVSKYCLRTNYPGN